MSEVDKVRRRWRKHSKALALSRWFKDRKVGRWWRGLLIPVQNLLPIVRVCYRLLSFARWLMNVTICDTTGRLRWPFKLMTWMCLFSASECAESALEEKIPGKNTSYFFSLTEMLHFTGDVSKTAYDLLGC